ncbi:Uncharacterised protein [Mycobacteroides abscessus subsp. abscessus]|nr:Uncharacterised protein [Mycobacteroides abscessus subsp. abscessus]
MTFPQTHRALPLTALALAAAMIFSGCGVNFENTQDSNASSSAATESSASKESPAASSSSISDETNQKPAELFGGGTEIFPDRRFVALYGSPENASLGVLGEYSPQEAVKQAKTLAEQYQPFSKEPVQPAFEIIATVASSEAGEDGDYSRELSVKKLLPLIDEAEKNGVYVILDLQPGHDTFPHQVKQYEELLKRPNVGIGLDPEWRLAPGQMHLQQIGSVDAAEVNEALEVVADVVKQEKLPQKLVVLHQFTQTMITNRELIDTSHPELALTIHADGHGTPDLKKDTYNALLQGLSPEIYPSWKNFYDEDTPTLSPEQTYNLNPKPWVVTYQ